MAYKALQTGPPKKCETFFWEEEHQKSDSERICEAEPAARRLLARRGSALLITILIMSILLLLTLGLSRLIIGDMRSTVDTIAAGKAYYAAEAGIETALLELHQNLSGFEKTDGLREINQEDGITAKYSIANQTQIYPWRDPEEYDLKEINPQEFYATLPLNESITIPLFIIDEDGKTQNVKDFRVEYYVGYDSKNLKSSLTQKDVDVLRWKIFGLSQRTNRKTEAISDYFPVLIKSDATSPMCLGTPTAINKKTNIEDYPTTTCFTSGNLSASHAREYYENKDGNTVYYAKDPIGLENAKNKNTNQADTAIINPKLENPLNNSTVNAESLPQPTTPTSAQIVNQDPDSPKGTSQGYPIETFMEDHDNKYLTLTNIINPAVIQADSDSVRKAIANIHYRVVIFPSDGGSQKTVREYATIRSEGLYKDIQKTIEAKIKLDQFLPVFNFSLYRTETEKKVQ